MTLKSAKLLILYAFLAMMACLCYTPTSEGQGANIGSNSSPVVSRNGLPMSGVDISVCQPLAVTGGSVSSGVAYLTMSSNPITAGFVSNSTLLVSGFSGVNDSALNAGTLSNGVVTGGWTTLSVTSTQIIFNTGTSSSYSLTTTGTILQFGNSATSCAGLSSVYSNQALTSAVSQPFTSDQLGNWNVFAASGVYYVQFYAANIDTRMVQIATYFNNSSASVCTTTPNSFQYDNGGNFGCTPDITFSSPHTYNFGSSGTYSFAGVLNATGGGSFGGTFSGAPTVSGNWVFSGQPSFTFFTISSFSEITNLNANYLQGNTWAIPGTIGSTTPNSGAFSSVVDTALSTGCVNNTNGTLGSTGAACPNGTTNQTFQSTHSCGASITTTAGTLCTITATLPASGTFRAFLSYALGFTFSGAEQEVACWIYDGTNTFGQQWTGTSNGSSGGQTSLSWSGYTTSTYTGGAGNVNFSIVCQDTNSRATSMSAMTISPTGSGASIGPTFEVTWQLSN